MTGGAGFVGSTLTHRLLREGWAVTVVDRVADYYDPAIKRENLAWVEKAGATIIEADILDLDLDLDRLVEDVGVIFHQAGQPGVRRSWADQFSTYTRDNILATQRLLDAARRYEIDRFVYASSSSVYGDNSEFPFTEQALPAPKSPYGVTKLAGEHLASLYAANFGVPTVALRYFTVYGPRQRPDMATHRLIESALHGTPFRLLGDGLQERDFTFVDDIVEANMLAATKPVAPGAVLNIGGGSWVSMLDLIDRIEGACGAPVRVERAAKADGDVQRTGADASAATAILGWTPKVTLDDGLAAQVNWHRTR